MIPYGAILIHIVTLILPGAALLAALAPRCENLRIERWLPLSFLIGWTLQSTINSASLLLAERLIPNLYPIVAVTLPLLLSPWLYLSGRLSLFGCSAIARIAASRATLLIILFLLAATLARLIILWTEAVSFPLFSWDGRMIWNLKARILFEEGTIFGDSWMNPYRIHFHRDYPLMLPYAYAGIYDWAGAVSERAPRVFLAIMMSLFVIYFFDAVRTRAGAMAGAVGAFIMAGMAFRMDYGHYDGLSLLTGVADFPLAFVAFGAFDLLLRAWNTGSARWNILSALLVAGCLQMKAEGVIVAALWCGISFLLLVFHRRSFRLHLPSLFIAAIVIATFAAPWILLKAGLPNFYDEKFSAEFTPERQTYLVARALLIVEYYLEESIMWWRWGAFWVVYLAALPLLWFGRRGNDFVLDLIVFGWMGAYGLAYLLSPLHLGYHIETSIGRLFSHFQPLALFSLLIKCGRMHRLSRS